MSLINMHGDSVDMRHAIIILALMLFAGTAVGASFSVPLTGLVGTVDFPTSSGKGVSFDMGQQFSSIQNVSIEIEAQVFAQELDVCGTLLDPQACVPTAQLLGFFAQLDTEGGPVFSVQGSGGLSFGEFGALEGSGVDIAAFDDRFVQLGFDYLLDGQGSLTLFWNSAYPVPGTIIQNVTEPSGEIFSARLIIEGTPIPEPSTALLLTGGLLVLSGIKECKSFSNS